MKNLQQLIEGSTQLRKNTHIPINDHFKVRGYNDIIPYQQENEPRQLIREFYEMDNTFSLTDDTLKQLQTVYKVDNKFGV